MKKYIIIGMIVLGVILGGIAYAPRDIEYIAPEVVEKEVVKEVDALEQAIHEAQEAQRKEIETTAQAAYDATYAQEMKKVELEVIRDFNEKLETRKVQLEKETKQY